MMKVKQSFGSFVLFVMLQGATLETTEAAVRQKRVVNMNAFSNDFNKCLFNYWTPFVEKNSPVLGKAVNCKGEQRVQLCYGANPARAQFAVCYNKQTLIPEFTGHVLQPNIPEGGGRDEGGFRSDATVDPVAVDADYAANQATLYDNYNQLANQFCSRGHLTPNADFATPDARSYTMVTTNIAPQWQAFNGGNWGELEKALRNYATRENHALFMFTGTSGKAKNSNGADILLNGRVLAPEYYWKAVCDPIHKQSIFFFAVNNIGNARVDKKKMGCFKKLQTQKLGIIQCSSMDEAKTSGIVQQFNSSTGQQLPEFLPKSCQPSVMGKKFLTYIENSRLQ